MTGKEIKKEIMGYHKEEMACILSRAKFMLGANLLDDFESKFVSEILDLPEGAQLSLSSYRFLALRQVSSRYVKGAPPQYVAPKKEEA